MSTLLETILVFMLFALMIYAPTYKVTHQLMRKWYIAFKESKTYTYWVWERWDRHKPKYSDCWCSRYTLRTDYWKEYKEIQKRAQTEEAKNREEVSKAISVNDRIFPLP